ncbi:MAG: cytochrome c oxidase subunit II [Methanobacteriota archaeon]
MPGRRSLLAAIPALALALLSLSPRAAAGDTPGETATDELFFYVLVPAIAISILVMFLIGYAVLRFRKRRGRTTPPANPKTHDTTLEATWTIVPAVILAVVGLLTFQTLQVTDTIPEDPDLVVRVTGHQWFWTFSVEDRNGTVTNTTGAFTVKVGQTVVLLIESVDVVHSLYIPGFGLKVDAFPGRQNVYWFRALEAGDFVIRCAEFCGLNHADMTAILHVEPA